MCVFIDTSGEAPSCCGANWPISPPIDHKHSLLPISDRTDAQLACSVGLVDHGLDDPPPRVDEPEREEGEEEEEKFYESGEVLAGLDQIQV